MTERLGEILLHGGALTEAQLEEVLSAQSIYGGRLGTNLVEMGLLSEENLARVLNQKLGVPCVDAASLETVPAALLALIPREMVQRFKVLPVALDGKKLTLAMADPSDFGAIDEIGFYTGLVIVPRVCSELRLSMALEHHYGIKRVLHFIPVQGGVRTRMLDLARKNAGMGPFVESQTPASPFDPDQKTETAPDAPSANAAPQPRARRVSMESVATRFAAATGEAEVVETLMSYLRSEFDRAGFLSIRRGSVIGVLAVTGEKTIPSFCGYTIGVEEAGLLKKVLNQKAPYVGVLPEGGGESQILAKIGGRSGGPALLLPLVLGGFSVAFLLVGDENGRLGTGLFDLQRVVGKAELAFEMLAIRKKIGLV